MLPMASFLMLVAAVTILAGAIASVSGFGIGSLLTPLLASEPSWPSPPFRSRFNHHLTRRVEPAAPEKLLATRQ